jgi:hypothetical protein
MCYFMRNREYNVHYYYYVACGSFGQRDSETARSDRRFWRQTNDHALKGKIKRATDRHTKSLAATGQLIMAVFPD